MRYRRRTSEGRYETDRWSAGTMIAIAVAALLGLGVLLWAMRGDDRTASTNPSSTVGQSTETPPPDASPQRNPSDRAPAPAPQAQ